MTNNSLSAQNAAFQNGIQHGHTLLHDYSNESHYNYAVSTLGGLAYLKKNYPLVHDLFEDARKQHLLGPKKQRQLIHLNPKWASRIPCV